MKRKRINMGKRIGSWKGTDVIKVGKHEYDTSSEIRPKKYIYAVYNLIGDGNTYLIKDDTVFAQLLNEDGERVCANAQVPKLKIGGDYWWVIYDNGVTFCRLIW